MPPPPLPWRVRTAPERFILLFVAAAGLVGALLWLGHYAGWGLTTCIWRGLTGLPCAGCGGTRAASMLLGGDMSSALLMNPAAVVAVLATLALALYSCLVLVFGMEPFRPAFLRGGAWRFVLGGLLVANWIYLLLAGRV